MTLTKNRRFWDPFGSLTNARVIDIQASRRAIGLWNEGPDDAAHVLGPSHADIAVEPTRSQKMTVSWRRLAASFDSGTDDSVATSAMAEALRANPRAPRSPTRSSNDA